MNEYITRAIPEGSSVYYSLRFINDQHRYGISCLYAFSHEIEITVSQRREPEMVQRKLSWWEQELSRLSTGVPTHPISQTLQPVLQQYSISVDVLTGILIGISKRLANPNYKDFKSFSEQHYRAISSFPLLVSLVTLPNTETRPLAFVHDLGIALQAIEVIHDLRSDLLRGYVYLPEDDLNQYKITEQELLQLKSSENLAKVLKQLAIHARNQYQQALTKINHDQYKSQLASLIIAQLYFKLLDEIEKDNFNVLHKRILLPPLRKLWCAWLASRKYK